MFRIHQKVMSNFRFGVHSVFQPCNYFSHLPKIQFEKCFFKPFGGKCSQSNSFTYQIHIRFPFLPVYTCEMLRLRIMRHFLLRLLSFPRPIMRFRDFPEGGRRGPQLRTKNGAGTQGSTHGDFESRNICVFLNLPIYSLFFKQNLCVK